jgi:predicted enzyme related to lactoylglutathione lyase
MVIAILEPVCAGIMVSLINKYILSGSLGVWIQSYCSVEGFREEEENVEEEGGEVSSTNTSISDASVHVHYHA